MTQPTSPSGSRWEPVPPAGAPGVDEPGIDDADGPVRGRTDDTRRRRRGPLLVALVALLSIGAVSAGAYEESTRSRDEGTSVGTGGAPATGGPGTRGGYGPGSGGHDHEGRDGRRHVGPQTPDGQPAGPWGASS